MLRSVFIILSLFFFGEVHAQYQPNSYDTEDLFYTFMNYQTAVLTNNSEMAISYIDNNSIAYYNDLLDKVKTSDSTTLLSEDISTIFTVLYVRFMAPDGEIEKMKSEKDLLKFMFKNMMMREIGDQEVRDIFVNDQTAIVFVSRDINDPVSSLYFVKVDNNWKLDFLSQIHETNKSFENLLTSAEVKKHFNGEKDKVINKVILEKGWILQGRNIWYPKQ